MARSIRERLDAAARALVAGGGDLGAELLDEARDELRETWHDLEGDVRSGIEWAARETPRVLRDRLAGRDTSRQEAHLRAVVANWTWVGADRVAVRWREFLEEAAKVAARVLVEAAKAAL